MWSDDIKRTTVFRHGAYVCFSIPAGHRRATARLPVSAIAKRLALDNEFEPPAGHPRRTVGFLRAVDATPGEIGDDDVMRADAIVHIAAETADVVEEFCIELVLLLGPSLTPRVLRGVMRPMTYTGTAMYNFAYAHQVLQQPAAAMANAFLIPMSKISEWWEKDWMERHTYFLPRYDDAGQRLADGHALAAAAGIPWIMRRFYKNAVEPAPIGEYDFLTYFECADASLPIFRQVCASLRDQANNPEWKYVREGPTWHGRRVETWGELFENRRRSAIPQRQPS